MIGCSLLGFGVATWIRLYPAILTVHCVAVPPASGNVTFYDGTAVVGIAAVKSGAAAFSRAALATGKHVLQARYDGDTGQDLSVPAGPESVVAITGQEAAVGQNLLSLR
jgi:hypothetical protein